MAESARRIPLHTKILIGLVLGALVGGTLNSFIGAGAPNLTFVIDQITNPIGQLFLRLLLLLVVPLVFSSLVVGVAGLGDLRRIGRIGVKSLVYTLIISAISVVIGLTLANTIKPGKRISTRGRRATGGTLQTGRGEARRERDRGAKSTDTPLLKVVKTIVPTNIFYSIGGRETPDMLGLMFFAVFLGICMTMVPDRDRGAADRHAGSRLRRHHGGHSGGDASRAVRGLLPAVHDDGAIRLRPAGAAWAGSCVTVLLGLAIHMFGVYSASVWFLSRINPLDFFRRIKTAMITAFSTSSSNATLPTALRVSEENLGVPRDINSFVLTVGATANQNGTALYEGVTVLFLAQLAGVDLSMGQQLMVVYLAILGGIGTAGVPSGSIPFIIVVLAQIGVNPALIGIILGVDRILDMCRTVLNVTGDITIATYVARSEGYELLKEIPAPAKVDL